MWIFFLSLLICSFARLPGLADELNSAPNANNISISTNEGNQRVNPLVVDHLDICNRTKPVPPFAHFPKFETMPFDQYRLEEVLFNRWLDYEGTLVGKVVVVPSPLEWCIFAGAEHWDWSKHLLPSLAKRETNRQKLLEYWNYLKTKFDPHLLKVIHISFAWGGVTTRDILMTLIWAGQQDQSFVNHVVLVSLDGPNVCEEDGKLLVRHNSGVPLIITAPYPTRNNPPLSATDEFPREILVSLDGRYNNTKGFRPSRKKLQQIMDKRFICKEKYPNCKFHDVPEKIWLRAQNSKFCLEPPGDTVTRSHLSVAILAGCIPVVFDGERYIIQDGKSIIVPPRKEVTPSNNHHWPWRTTSGFNLTYTDFAVVVNSHAFVSGEYDLLQELRLISPDRYEKMRKNLLAVAPYFSYNRALEVNAFTALTKTIESYIEIIAL